jgi:hypothetical protein
VREERPNEFADRPEDRPWERTLALPASYHIPTFNALQIFALAQGKDTLTCA